MDDLLTLAKLTPEGRDDIEIPEVNKIRGRSTELYTLRKVRLEKARNQYVFKNCRLANRIDNEINFMESRGLKNRILNLMWKFVNKSFNTKYLHVATVLRLSPMQKFTDNSLKARLKGQNDPSTSSRKFPTTTTASDAHGAKAARNCWGFSTSAGRRREGRLIY